MVNWTAIEVILKCAAVFANIVHLSAGAYALDCCFTMIYDWEIITGKRRWKWTMPLYFICKWIMFFACIAMILVLNIDKPINCQALYTFAQFAGNTAIGSASTLLMLRTIAIWNRNLWVTIPLVILSLGQWGILFHGMTTVRSTFAGTCVLVTTGDKNNLFLNLLYLYTMFIDLVVLIVSTVGLLMTPGRSSLWKLLFRDGIIFFLMAFFSNAVSAVFLLLNLNPAMNLIFSVPAACITASAATRSFIRLSTWAQADVYVHQSTSMGRATRPGQIGSNGKPDKHNMSVVHFTRTRPMDDDLETGNATRMDNNSEDFDTKPTNTRSVTFTQSNVPGVMITMDTFSSVVDTTQNGKGPQRSKSINSARSSLEFDSAIIDHARREPGPRTHGYGDGKPSAAGAW